MTVTLLLHGSHSPYEIAGVISAVGYADGLHRIDLTTAPILPLQPIRPSTMQGETQRTRRA